MRKESGETTGSTLIRVCFLDAGPGVNAKMSYRDFRRAVLKAGRFSVFEATETKKAARFYTRLCKDPLVRTQPVGFPWTKVEKAR